MRIESNRLLRNGGYLHRLRDSDECWRRRDVRDVRHVRLARQQDWTDFGVLDEKFRKAVDPRALARLASDLGVDCSALRRLGVGWDGAAWTFPMQNAAGVVIGIRRRLPDGRKLSVRGGREGLFIPTAFPESGLLVVAEGPTDCAALLTLGFSAVGRPSCRGGTEILTALSLGRPVALLADADEVGQRGAEALAVILALCSPDVRIVLPPRGIKDAREWVQSGASGADVQRAMDGAKLIRIGIETREVAH